MSQLENVNYEEWRTIKEFPNYQVSSLGRITNIKTNRILKPFNNKTSGGICEVLKGRRKTAGGYTFKYKEE